MRIAINTRLLLPGRLDGIGWFTAETAKRLVTAHPSDDFYFFFDRRPDGQFIYADNVHGVCLLPPARHPILWYLYFEWATSLALRRYKIDLYLSPDGMIPLHTHVPTVSVIHDLNFEHTKDNLRPSHQRYMTHFFPRFAQKATRIATVSQYSKNDIADTYGINSSKIDVVYDGAHELYRPLDATAQQAVRSQYTGGSPYLLFVSTILKRKNLANLLLAFDMVKEGGHSDLKLVVVGNRAWWQDELAKAYDNMRHRQDVLLMGRLETSALTRLMAAADALVYPSLFEGFGIPILEAMYAETPVVCSCTTSMPEVGGNAVLYANPSSPDEIAHAIELVYGEDMREHLIERSRQQRQLFSWDNTADLLWQSMMRAIQQR